MKKYLLIILLASCDGLKSHKVGIVDCPDLMASIKSLSGDRLQKEVMLDAKVETRVFDMNKEAWATEFAFLKEISPNQPEYVGAFDQQKDDRFLLLELKDQEKGNLKKIRFERDQKGRLIKVDAVFHEEKDVYIHHRDITIALSDEQIASYTVEGYQKILFKDTIIFRIKGKILN